MSGSSGISGTPIWPASNQTGQTTEVSSSSTSGSGSGTTFTMATSNLTYDPNAAMSNAIGGGSYSNDDQSMQQMFLKFSMAVRGNIFNQIDNAMAVAPINLATAVSYLDDAAYDLNKSISSIMGEAENGELNSQQRSAISELRNLQGMVFGMVRNLTGVGFSDDELRALSQKGTSGAEVNSLITNPKDQAVKKAQDPMALDENATFDLAHSAGFKVSTGVGNLVQQASSLIASAQGSPRQSAFTLQRALRLLNQAEGLLSLVGGGSPTQVFANFDSNGTEKAQIAQLKNTVETLLQSTGQGSNQSLFNG
jgi:hypothetical protein